MPGREPFEQEYVEQENERLLRLLALTAYRNEQAELAEFAASPECVPPTPEQKQSFMDFIDKEIKEAQKRERKQYFIKIARRAACIVVILGLALTTTAYMANHQRMGFIAKDYDKYSDLQGSVDELQERPAGWESEYYPTWMPEGFVLTDSSSNKGVLYYKKGNYIISFAIFENSNSHAILGLDTEGMDKHSYIINDEECAIYSTPDLQRSTFALQRDDIAIAIFGDLSPNDIINIVKNIHGLN